MVRLRVLVAAIALIGPLTGTAHSFCNYDSVAGHAEINPMLDAYNKMNVAEDVAGKCALLPKIIAQNQRNKARTLAGCRASKDIVDGFIRASDQDLNEYRKVLREECNTQAIATAEREKSHSSKNCEGLISAKAEPYADKNCLFVINSCGVDIFIRTQHSETKSLKEYLVGARPRRFCTIDKDWRLDYLGYRVAK